MISELDNFNARQDSDDDYVLAGSSTSEIRKGRRGYQSFEVAVPAKIPPSDRTSSPSSLYGDVQDTAAGYDTLVTTTEATSTGSDVSNAGQMRVSASARAVELRASVFSLNTIPRSRKRSIKSLIVEDSLSETSEACIAREFPAAEYNDPSLKKAKFSTIFSKEEREIQNSTDEDNDLLSEPTSFNDKLVLKRQCDSRMMVSLGSRSRSRTGARDATAKTVKSKIKETISDTTESLLSEPDSDLSGPGEDAGDMEDVYHELSGSEYRSSTADLTDDDFLTQRTRNPSQNQGIRASLAHTIRAPLISPVSNGQSRLGSRVRRISLPGPKKQG